MTDQGPGVEPALLPHIFERYFSHRPDAGAAGGEAHFGVGLWITRQNVLTLGGSIVPLPGEPHGLRMVVTLPHAAAPG